MSTRLVLPVGPPKHLSPLDTDRVCSFRVFRQSFVRLWCLDVDGNHIHSHVGTLRPVSGFDADANGTHGFSRFMRALKAQGISRNTLPYKAPLQPYGSWFALVSTGIITLFKGK